MWAIPNEPLLADDMHGQRAIDLGCGTGYVSAWMRRRGASVYAIDNSEAQLPTARRLNDLHGLDDIEWVLGNAATVDEPGGIEFGPILWLSRGRRSRLSRSGQEREERLEAGGVTAASATCGRRRLARELVCFKPMARPGLSWTPTN